MTFKNQIIQDAKKERDRQSLIDEYGTLMWWAGYPINALLAILGGIADGAILFAILYTAFGIKSLAIIGAIIGAMLLQYFMGSPILRMTKNLKTGKLFSVKGFGKMFAFNGAIVLIAVSLSLYFSWNTDKLVQVAVSPTFEAEEINIEKIKTYYDTKRDQARDAMEKEKARLAARVTQLEKEKVLDQGQWVHSWTARRAKESIERSQIPAITKIYQSEIETINAQQADEIAAARIANSKTESEKESTIIWGGLATRYGNIGINILRILIVIFYMIFLLDAIDEQEAAQANAPAPEQPLRTIAEQLFEQGEDAVSNTTRTIVRGFVPAIAEQPQTLVTQGRTTEQPQPEQLFRTTPEQSPNNPNNHPRTTVPNNPEQPRTVVHEHTRTIVNNTDLVNLKRKTKLYFLRSFFPSGDTQYQKRSTAPAKLTLANNLLKYEEHKLQLLELGVMTHEVGQGKDRTLEFK